MKMTIRWKLMASYLVFILAIGAILYVYLNHTLGQYVITEITDGLLSEARLARLMASREIADLHRDAPAAASAIGRESRARATIIDREGVVQGDSQVGPEELKELENHRDRPEIRDAVKQGEGTSIRYSATLRTPMLYVALPFSSSSGEAATLRLALPLSSLDRIRAKVHALLAAALCLGTVIALALSYMLSHVASRSLRSMAAIATRIGQGEFDRRIPVAGSDEVGDLAKVMNEMARRIKAQVETISVEKARLDTILRGMGEGLIVVDLQGTVTLVNPAFRTLFGIADDIEGTSLMEITRHPSLHDAFNIVIATQNERVEEIVLPFAERTLLTHWVPLLDAEGIQGVVAVFHDISDLKKLETVRKDFVANVSHELRTPVTVIKGYAETLLSRPPGDHEETTRFIGKIHTHAERLAALVTDLLTLSELESGSTGLNLAPVSVEGIVSHAALLLEQKARDKEITVRWSGLGTMPLVLADRRRLEQVAVNLLDNALKYTPHGGSITVSAAEAGAFVRVAVSDTGIGISARDLPRLFERFYRVDSARSRTEGGTGTGLGLSIVKHIVLLHSGTVEVESTPGKGSVFTISLHKA